MKKKELEPSLIRFPEPHNLYGCPGHTATLTFQSSANTYHYKNGKGREMSFDVSEATAILKMFKSYSETRGDTVSFDQL